MTIAFDVAETKLQKYLAMTEKALSLVQINAQNGSENHRQALYFLSTARNYVADAKHFKEKGDLLTAIAAGSYAHAWLDAGAVLGLFKVESSSGLFAVD